MADVSRETLSELARASVDFTTAYNELLNASNPKMLLAYEQECEEKLASVIYAKLRQFKEQTKSKAKNEYYDLSKTYAEKDNEMLFEILKSNSGKEILDLAEKRLND